MDFLTEVAILAFLCMIGGGAGRGDAVSIPRAIGGQRRRRKRGRGGH